MSAHRHCSIVLLYKMSWINEGNYVTRLDSKSKKTSCSRTKAQVTQCSCCLRFLYDYYLGSVLGFAIESDVNVLYTTF